MTAQKSGRGRCCAICADEVSEVVMRPLGKRDAMVAVCLECDAGPIVARDSERQYEPTGGLPSIEQMDAGARRAMGDAEFERQGRIEERLGRAPAPATDASAALWKDYVCDARRRFRTRASRITEPRGIRAPRKR